MYVYNQLKVARIKLIKISHTMWSFKSKVISNSKTGSSHNYDIYPITENEKYLQANKNIQMSKGL